MNANTASRFQPECSWPKLAMSLVPLPLFKLFALTSPKESVIVVMAADFFTLPVLTRTSKPAQSLLVPTARRRGILLTHVILCTLTNALYACVSSRGLQLQKLPARIPTQMPRALPIFFSTFARTSTACCWRLRRMKDTLSFSHSGSLLMKRNFLPSQSLPVLKFVLSMA